MIMYVYIHRTGFSTKQLSYWCLKWQSSSNMFHKSLDSPGPQGPIGLPHDSAVTCCNYIIYILLYYIILYYIILYYIILFYIILYYYIIFYYIILYLIILYHIILYYTILYIYYSPSILVKQVISQLCNRWGVSHGLTFSVNRQDPSHKTTICGSFHIKFIGIYGVWVQH